MVLSIYEQMLLRGVRPDKRTIPRIITACRLTHCLPFGEQLHAHALKLGLSTDNYVITALIQMYGHLNSADAAKLLFDQSPRENSVAWTLMVKLYMAEDEPGLALHLFNQMVVDSRAKIDPVALGTALKACGRLKSLQEGRNVHEISKKCGLEFDLLVSNSLLKMYTDCGSTEEGRAVFDRMPSKDAISWTSMIGGYVKEGGFNEGLKLFRQMNFEGIKPDSLSIASILPACARVAAHKHGKEIHGYLLRNGTNSNLTIQNAVMDMYVKSGSIEYASKIFDEFKERDVVSWTIITMGYSLHGQGIVGFELFQALEQTSSIEIDEPAYFSVLHACTTACMVDEGRFYFGCIRSPKVTTCILMVALLARAGLFEEARLFIEGRQIQHNTEVLRALLDGCRIHQNLMIGNQVIEKLRDLEPLNADNYVLLSNWYAGLAEWDMVNKTRETMKNLGLKPRKACSWIEFQNKVHVFETGDVSHPRSNEITCKLQCLTSEIEVEEEERKICYSDFIFHDVEEEQECDPIRHSEMLAISFGIISTEAGTTIRVTKNHRVCSNCHNYAKIISQMLKREIILKDPNRFHHFKEGSCSCRDHW